MLPVQKGTSLGRRFLSVAWPIGVQLLFFFCSGFRYFVQRRGISNVGQRIESVKSSFLIHQGGYHDLLFDLDDSFTS